MPPDDYRHRTSRRVSAITTDFSLILLPQVAIRSSNAIRPLRATDERADLKVVKVVKVEKVVKVYE